MDKIELDKILRSALPQVDWQTPCALVSDGVITSLDILVLISEIYREKRIRIPSNEMKASRFNSPEAILALCNQYENGRN